ncbi:MFS transporter [Actinophytocola sp. S1-96]|uniref:MFS transporter n=2 Tax=Actinophytocola gossypii TaxID=2812003 RepID=A0ABT2JAR5_9PSEU|nr:MFS transporter [Actinophytocola gossypii]
MTTLVTIAAFEHLGVSTAMPRMVADLDGAALYSWPFTAFLAASVMATVLSGRVSDRLGPVPALLTGPALFLAGLFTAGLADGMAVLLVGRVLQGLGLGTQVVGIYVLVALVFPVRRRPAAFGLLAAAWVVPSLVGPTAAGLVTEHVGWRWVFLGITPFALLGVLLLLPAIRSLPPNGGDRAPARRGVVPAAVATAAGIAALTWAAQHAVWWLALAGIAALVPGLRVLLPRGTFANRRGLPATVLARGVFAGAFFAVEAYVPLTLTAVHGFSPAAAGLPLTVGACGWAAASHWQGRYPDIPRERLIRVGMASLGVALACTALIGPDWGLGWLSVPCWLLAGASMGLAYPSISVLGLEYAGERERGFVSSALQVSDMTMAATMVGLGGVMLATFASTADPTAAVVPLNLLMAGLALVGALTVRLGRARS